jgi:ribosomal 30S subunit maturation factor RimM
MNPVWILEFGGRDLMIPATHVYVHKIDTGKKILHLDLPEGMCDL